MTALATGLALVPLVISGDIPGHEIEHPMAIVILGGLVTSTVLNLFIVPSLYLRFGKNKEEKNKALFAHDGAAVVASTAQNRQLNGDDGYKVEMVGKDGHTQEVTVDAGNSTSQQQKSGEQESDKQDEQSLPSDGKPP